MTAGRGQIERGMIVVLVLMNVVMGYFLCYRLGKQSVINNLIKEYKNVVKENEDKQIIINCLKEQLKDKED